MKLIQVHQSAFLMSWVVILLFALFLPQDPEVIISWSLEWLLILAQFDFFFLFCFSLVRIRSSRAGPVFDFLTYWC